ncbi:MAG: hypothetical protein WCI63_04575 [bacterium]
MDNNENMNLSDSENNKPRFSLKTILVILLIMIMILTVAGFVWWYFKAKATKVNVEKTATEEIAENGCGKIVTEDGKTEGMAPWQPIVKARITGIISKDKEICHWVVNGEDLGNYKPYGDYCTLYDLDFIQLGYYKVSLDVEGLENCPKDILLKVTSLDKKETDEQAKIIEKIEAGATVEEIELLESHKIRKY